MNPDTIAAQVEGGTLFGLTAALYGAITLKKRWQTSEPRDLHSRLSWTISFSTWNRHRRGLE